MNLVAPIGEEKAWSHNLIASLLWPRGRSIRSEALDTYNPFSELPLPERLLLNPYVENNSEKIYLSDPLWRRKAQNILSKIGTITLLSDITDGAQRADAFNYFATQPIEVDYFLGFAKLLRVERIEKIMEIEFEMVEFS